MPQAMLGFEDFKFGTGQQGSKEMGGLGRGRFSGWHAHGRILFVGLMVFFHFPSFLISRGGLSLRQVGITADQI